MWDARQLRIEVLQEFASFYRQRVETCWETQAGREAAGAYASELYRQRHPGRVLESKKKTWQKKKARMALDPEYREKIKAQNYPSRDRAYQAKRALKVIQDGIRTGTCEDPDCAKEFIIPTLARKKQRFCSAACYQRIYMRKRRKSKACQNKTG